MEGHPGVVIFNTGKQSHGLSMSSHLTLTYTFQVEGGAKKSFGGETTKNRLKKSDKVARGDLIGLGFDWFHFIRDWFRFRIG